MHSISLSKAGLVPGDLIYSQDSVCGTISHAAVYVGQNAKYAVLVDIFGQHANADSNSHDGWTPVDSVFTEGRASVEFVHLTYPGE